MDHTTMAADYLMRADHANSPELGTQYAAAAQAHAMLALVEQQRLTNLVSSYALMSPREQEELHKRLRYELGVKADG